MKSIGLMLSVFFMSILITRYNDVTIYANDSEPGKLVSNSAGLYFQPQNIATLELFSEQLSTYKEKESMVDSKQENIEDILGDKYIKIVKPSSKTLKVSLEDLYLTHSIRVNIEGLEAQSLKEQSVQSISETEQTSDKSIESLEVSYMYNEKDYTYTAVFLMTLDTVYVHNVYEDDAYIYIDLVDPHKVYDRIIVVDAGHGGSDVGTYTPDMKYLEKDINLNIVLQLKGLLDHENIKVYYTRTSDEKVYLNPRVNLANNVKADFFISVHCNSNVDQNPYGTEVLYGKNRKHYEIGSKELATICLEEVIKEAGTKDMGIISGENIYIINKSKVPVSLIEVAFMSNKKDMEYLSKAKNQEKIATGIFNGIMNAYKEFED
jgi:N-acetylmuramoyl-L-alanine amidase